jgi:hypothetical protein
MLLQPLFAIPKKIVQRKLAKRQPEEKTRLPK